MFITDIKNKIAAKKHRQQPRYIQERLTEEVDDISHFNWFARYKGSVQELKSRSHH